MSNSWRDYSDLKSFLHDADGKVLAEILSGGWDTWMVSVNSKPIGRWIGRDAAKAACERRVGDERPGRIVMVPPSVEPSAAPTLIQRFMRPFGRPS